MGVIDLRDIKWDDLNSTSTGMVPKYIDDNVFMKLSTYDEFTGFYGEESKYEELAYRIGKLLELNIVEVIVKDCLIKYNGKEYKTKVSISNNFGTTKNFISIENYCVLNNKQAIDLLKDSRFKDDLSKIIEFDFIINNIDRHGRNIEINEDKVAPIFDNSLSFFSKIPDKALGITLFEIYNCNNFIGYSNLKNNLLLIENKLDLLENLDDFKKEIEDWGRKYNKSNERIKFIKELVDFRINVLKQILVDKELEWE